MRYLMYIVVVLIAIPEVYAEEKSTPESITLEQVIINVLKGNPQLGMHDFEAKAAVARIQQARLRKPLNAKVDIENFIGTGYYHGLKRFETTLSLATVLESGDKFSSRGELAQQQANLLANEQDSKRLDILSEAARRFVHVVIDQQRLLIGQDKLALVKRTYEIVEHRVKAGRSHIAEQRRVVIALARAEIELEHAEHELASSRLKLATSWGETKPQFTTAHADLFDLPSVDSFTRLEALLEQNPDLLRFATEQRLAQARIRLAQTRRTPNLELAGGIRYFNDSNDGAFVLSASIPFGAQQRAAPVIEEMQQLMQREPRQHEQRRLALYSSLYEIYQELLHAKNAFQTLNQRIIPEAERAAEDYEQGYQSGRFSLLELTESQRTLLDARLEVVMAAAKYHRFRIEIERLTGTAMRPKLNSGVNQ